VAGPAARLTKVNSMGVSNPKRFTDAELRSCLDEGMRPSAIADRFGVSRAAVSKRLTRLEVSTTAATVAPEESRRYVSRTIDAMEELARCLHRVNQLQDACDDWLRDAEDPSHYDVGPRAHEVDVTYTDYSGEKPVTRKKPLDELLALAGERFAVEKSEHRHADPRELILRTVAEARQIVSTCAELAKLLATAKRMEGFQQAVLVEIGKESPEVAGRIADAVRRSLMVSDAFRGPDALPGS
jgi:hypothetical protein